MGPPRKFFTLNEAGRKELQKFWEKWEFISSRLDELKDKVDEDQAIDGDEVNLIWGEPNGGSAKPGVERHVQTEIRAIIGGKPFD